MADSAGRRGAELKRLPDTNVVLLGESSQVARFSQTRSSMPTGDTGAHVAWLASVCVTLDERVGMSVFVGRGLPKGLRSSHDSRCCFAATL